MSLAIAMKNVPTVRHQTICAVGFARWHSRRSPCARLTDPGCPDRTTLVARCGVLSAVADRIGWWAPLGQGDWSSMSASAEYARQLVPFASGWFLTVTVWVPPPPKRTSESCSWLAGAQNSLARATCLVLTIFGIAMAVSLGMESPVSYSIFSAASAGAAYAIVDPTSPSNAIETTHHRRLTQSG
jgi:hypothetical protein